MLASSLKNKILLLFGGVFLVNNYTFFPQLSAKSEPPPSWDEIESVQMNGDLKVFWNVGGGDNKYNFEESAKHGFTQILGLNPYADYVNKQKFNVNNYLIEKSLNPWQKPAYFETTVQQNLEKVKTTDYFYNDIEFVYNTDINKAWQEPEVREASQAKNIKEFEELYFREWSTWYTLPLKWAKENNPDMQIGLYGKQVFERDYFGFLKKPLDILADLGKNENQKDLKIWKYIEPYVDFYTHSIYVFYDNPDSIYYMAANVEENYLRSRRFSKKPVYPFIWLRYHDGGDKKVAGQELNPYQIEASAVLPFFTGGKGFVLWGWEPRKKGQYYHSLPIFMNSLSRVAKLSSKISKAKLIIDVPAYILWRSKQPLVRKLKVSNKEWIVMAIHPWQSETAEKNIRVLLGWRLVNLKIKGRHTEIYHLNGRKLTRLSMASQSN
jgi:hypothetical protein